MSMRMIDQLGLAEAPSFGRQGSWCSSGFIRRGRMTAVCIASGDVGPLWREAGNTAPQLWISRVDAEARQLSSGDGIKIYNERGEFGAKAHITDDVPPGVVWIRDGWVGLNHLTSGDAVLTGDALSLYPFSVGQADYGAVR